MADEVKALPDAKPIAAGLAFTGLCTMRNGEAALRWQRAAVGVALNATGLVGAAYRLLVSTSKVELAGLGAACIIVALMNYDWAQMLKRSTSFLDFFNDKLAEDERRCGIEGGTKIFSSRRYLRMRRAPRTVRSSLTLLAHGCIFLWALGAVAALTLLLLKIN